MKLILTKPPAKHDAPAVLPQRVASSSIDQIMSMEGDTMDWQARILVFFQGHIDEKCLARAVRLTIEAEPLLGYRFVSDRHRPYWQRIDEKDWRGLFSLTECSPSDPDLFNFMVEPINAEQAPQIRAGLFRSDDDILCIRSNHMAIDGGGAIQYLYLLSSLYRRLQSDPFYRPGVNVSGRQGPRQVLKHAGLLSSIKALSKVQMPGSEWGVPRTGDDMSGRAFAIRQLGPERLETIRAYARQRGVTMNDILLTAFCRSLFVTCDPPLDRPLRVEVPINLRRYLPADGEGLISNISAVYFLAIERRDGEAFEETLNRVHQDIERRKEYRTELAEMLLLELMTLPGISFIKNMKHYANFRIAHPVLSNLGVIDTGAVDFGNALVNDVQMWGPTLYPPNIGLGVSTFRQRMTLSLSYCSSAVDPRIIDHTLDLFLSELPGKKS